MFLLIRRLSGLLLALALGTGQLVACAGWPATPQARMACCAGASECPMHEAAGDDSHFSPTVSQTDADACCAASSRNDASPSALAGFVPAPLALIPAPMGIVLRPAGSVGHARLVPAPGSRLPRHLLLSILLV